MQGNKVNSGKSASANKPKGERVITKEKHVPAKVVIGNPPVIDFRPPEKHLKDAILVLVSDGKTTRSWTIHRPIGKTDLGSEDWVFSSSEEIPDLVARRVDDDAPRLAKLRAIYRYTLACAANPPLLERDDAGHYNYPCGGERDVIVAEARERAKRHTAAAFEDFKRGKPKEGEVPKAYTYLQCIRGQDQKSAEHGYVDFQKLESTENQVLEKYPDLFRTRSGQRKDKDQVSACEFGRYPTHGQAFDGLVYQISRMKVLGFADAKSKTETGEFAELANPPARPPPGAETLGGGELSDISEDEPVESDSDEESLAVVPGEELL